MLVQQLNRADPERIMLIVKNVDGGGSITTGAGACLVQSGASIDGISAVNSTAATWLGFCGVAFRDIGINGFGLVTSWGFAASVLLSNVGSSLTITAGNVLIPSAVNGAFFSVITSQAMSTLLYKYVFAATTVAPDLSNSANYVSGVVRAI